MDIRLRQSSLPESPGSGQIRQIPEKIQPAATDGYDGLLFPPEQSFDGHKVAKRASRARRISKIFDKFSNHSTSDT